MQPGSDLYGGSRWSRLAGLVSVLCIGAMGFSILTGRWGAAILSFLCSIITGYIGYSIAGGKANPALRMEASGLSSRNKAEMTEPVLKAFCELVIDHALQQSEKLTTRFEELLRVLDVDVTHEIDATVFTGFGFASWLIINLVWSNLDNTRLRRDLLSQSMTVVVQRIAGRTSRETASLEDLAMSCVRLQIDELRPFHMGFVRQAQESQDEPDVNDVMIYALEWIQTKIGLSDAHMERIVSNLVTEDMNLDSIVEIALQTNLAAETPCGKPIT